MMPTEHDRKHPPAIDSQPSDETIVLGNETETKTQSSINWIAIGRQLLALWIETCETARAARKRRFEEQQQQTLSDEEKKKERILEEAERKRERLNGEFWIRNILAVHQIIQELYDQCVEQGTRLRVPTGHSLRGDQDLIRPQLAVDTAEHAPWKYFQHLMPAGALAGDCPVIREQLAPGDYQLRLGKGTDAIWERKTPTDLSHGLIDGRYREQRARLNECALRNNQIRYLIEHEPLSYDWHQWEDVDNLAPFDTIGSCAARLRRLYGMHVIETCHILHTVWVLSKELETLARYSATLVTVCKEEAGLHPSYACRKKSIRKPRRLPRA